MATAPQMADVGLGARIRFARLALNVSVTEAARTCGVSRDSWTDYERDRRPVPSDVLKKFADEFNVSADWLLFGATRAKLHGKSPMSPERALRAVKADSRAPNGKTEPRARQLPLTVAIRDPR